MRILCTVIECADGLHADEGRTHSDLLHNIARNIREIAVDDTSVYVIEIIVRHIYHRRRMRRVDEGFSS